MSPSRRSTPSFSLVPVSLLVLLFSLATADIFFDNCLTPADHPSVGKGNFYNLCIQDHEFEDEKWSWTFTRTSVSETKFDSCAFSNTKEKTNNFTDASWTDVNFVDCTFNGYNNNDIVFDKTSFTNVHFSGCTFHSSVNLVFSEFVFNNVSFTDCIFEGDTRFELGSMNEVSFNTCKFKRSEDATTSSGNRSFTLREVTVRDMAVIESEFVTPVRFEGVAAADVSFNETSINQFHCHSPPIARKRGGDPKIEYFSGFNDTAFQKVTFFDKVFCDRTDWKGFFMGNVTFHADADFSNSQFLDLYWDKVDMETVDGSCLELDFSKSYIERRVLANTTIDCKANFEETTFETVFIKRFYGKLPNFKNAMFVNQEFVDGHCCSTACRPLRCLCNVSEPSGQCPVGYKDVNVSALTGCFPAHATVERHDGLVVTMEELAYAEKIAIGAGQQSDVFFFGHRSSDDVAEFVSIRHASTVKPLLLSAQHYLYVNGKLTTAETVRPGDRLRGPDGEDDLFVTEVDREQHRGLYAPTSIHGDLLVDGVVVSSYTSAIHPGLAHKLLHPLRLLYRYGFDSVVSRFTMLHERSWEHLPRALGIPLGPDRV